MKITDTNLTEELKNEIASHYDGSFYKSLTSLHNDGNYAWELFKFEENVEYEGKEYYCTLIEKYNYDPEDIECILDTEIIFENFEEN